MFKIRYWRDYPWWMQLMQLLLMFFILFAFASGLAVLVQKFTGVNLEDITGLNEKSPRQLINAALLLQFISATCMILLPAVLFAYATHPRPAHYLGMRKPGKSIHWGLTILVIISAIPILLSVAALVHQIDLPDTAKQMQNQRDNYIKAFLSMSSAPQFIIVFLILAVLPAFSEELLFRGIVMRLSAKRFIKPFWPIFFSGLVFALVHSDVYGFLSIFMAGILLGSIYYLTGSIWCSMLAHMIFNGIQVVAIFLMPEVMKGQLESTEMLPWYVPVTGLVIFAISFYLLWVNRTPLPDNWSDDFAGEKRPEE